jgi:hypothetical protein
VSNAKGAAANARGEVAIMLGGKRYVMRPDFEAIQAIDEASGSILALSRRLGSHPSLADFALVVTEGIRAHGRFTKNAMLAHYGIDGVKRMIARAGIANPAITAPIGAFMAAAITGGVAEPGEAGAADA